MLQRSAMLETKTASPAQVAPRTARSSRIAATAKWMRVKNVMPATRMANLDLDATTNAARYAQNVFRHPRAPLLTSLDTQCAVCGNGVVEAPEECDAGDKNGQPGSGCSKDCKKKSYCGAGHVDEGEECDAGEKNGKPGSGCDEKCHSVPVCGNGVVEKGEECDLGADNGKPGKLCDSKCRVCAVCGNGKVEAGEECDLGEEHG